MSLIPLLTNIVLSNDSDPSVILLAAGPFAGVAFFAMIFRFYRNIDKRYEFEDSTKVRSAITKAEDAFIGEVTGSSDSQIKGGNYDYPTWRVGQPMPLQLKSSALLKLFSRNRGNS